MGSIRDFEHISGCLLGGAVGDALGAPIEFASLSEIRRTYGERGIERYAPAYGRTGAITDDTQMTLFTLEGLIRAMMRYADRGICNPVMVVWHAYLRWLRTQGSIVDDPEFPTVHNGWLLEQKELHSRRGPGNTCLSALQSGRYGTIDRPINDSKGCGGVMRAAPAGLIGADPFRLGCEIAAITHGHPSGYLASGFHARMIGEIMHGGDLRQAIKNARQMLVEWPNADEVVAAVDSACELAEGADATAENVEELGAGWVAEEALAISLFSALKARDFAHGVSLAVNHSGDSDSTGAITGNILGALWGRSAIPEAFLEDLELRGVIEEMASDTLAALKSADRYWGKYPPW